MTPSSCSFHNTFLQQTLSINNSQNPFPLSFSISSSEKHNIQAVFPYTHFQVVTIFVSPVHVCVLRGNTYILLRHTYSTKPQNHLPYMHFSYLATQHCYRHTHWPHQTHTFPVNPSLRTVISSNPSHTPQNQTSTTFVQRISSKNIPYKLLS